MKGSYYYKFRECTVREYTLAAAAQFIFIIPGYGAAIAFHIVLYRIGWLSFDLSNFIGYWVSISILAFENYKALSEQSA